MITDSELSVLADSINNNPDDTDVVRIWKQTGSNSVDTVVRLHPMIKDRLTKAILSTRTIGG